MTVDRDNRLKRLRFRSWHRGTREADLIVGGYFDRAHGDFDEAAMTRFEALMDEQDADIVGWVMGALPVPARIDAGTIAAMRAVAEGTSAA